MKLTPPTFLKVLRRRFYLSWLVFKKPYLYEPCHIINMAVLNKEATATVDIKYLNGEGEELEYILRKIKYT